ncbi:DUF5677 domain-containing protein [Pontibacter sp. CAU 1760]
MTQPIQEIIPRELANDGVRALLYEFSKGIEETVNFGSHILKWDLDTAKGGDEQIPIILSLRHFLELIDSISILVKSFSVDPCKLILRGALETYFGIEYMLEQNTNDRCMAFMVWHTHKNLKSYKSLDSRNEQVKQLQQKLNSDKAINGFKIPENLKLNYAIQNLESLLKKPSYLNANKEYERLKSKGEKNPAWYRLFDGPKNIQELAERLNLSGLYEILYRYWSGPTHGTDILQGKLVGAIDNRAEIIQLRYPKDAQAVTSYAMTLSLKLFILFVDKRHSHKKQDYTNWYHTVKDLYQRVASKEQMLKINLD